MTMGPALDARHLARDLTLKRREQGENMSVWTHNDAGLLVPVSTLEVHHMQDSEGSTPYILLGRGD